MGVRVRYENALGAVEMTGDGEGDIRIIKMDGFGLAGREYDTVVYSGYDGQETVRSRALPRAITMAVEFCGLNVAERVRSALQVLNRKGVLVVEHDEFSRRISCSQVTVTDSERILKNRISTMVIQFVCDSPYFEDAEDTVVALYRRVKLLETPFSLPSMFGDIIIGADIIVSGAFSVEPVITLYYPDALEQVESIVITNEANGASIRLDYTPSENDVVTVDVKNRKISSSVNGNLIRNLSDDTFLGDFVLEKGLNVIDVFAGDVSAGFVAECKYNNLYCEAVIV
ncbi:MAG: phage tail family protein [Clostridia bacterium]|nr:phage tail family protein [Clostridia bacterium]